MRQRDGERHELRRLAAGEADHHPLIAGPLQLERVATLLCALSGLQRVAHARGDVRRLLFEIDLDQCVVGVESDRLGVVADATDGVADGALDVQLRVRGHFADDDAQSLGDRGLAGDARRGILREHAVEHRV